MSISSISEQGQKTLIVYINKNKNIDEITRSRLDLIINGEISKNFLRETQNIDFKQITDVINSDQDLEEKDPTKKVNLLTTLSQLELYITLEQTKTTPKGIMLKQIFMNLIKENKIEEGDKEKIEHAQQQLYPKKGGNKTKNIAGINNIMYIFKNQNIIEILKNMKIIAYTELPKDTPMEKSMLDGTKIRKYYFVSDEKLSGMFISGHDSIQSLYQLFDIKIPPSVELGLETTKSQFEIKDTLEIGDKNIQKIEEKLQTLLQDERKITSLKNKINELTQKNKELKETYKENILDTLKKFHQSNDGSILIKSLMNEKSFLNRFKDNKDIPDYLKNIIQKIQKNITIDDEEIILLYMYFAQHYLINTKSIQSILQNIEKLDEDNSKINTIKEQENINLFTVMEIIATQPNYIDQVQNKNNEILTSFEEENDISIENTFYGLRPLYLQSKNIYSNGVEQSNLYQLYESSLNRSDKKFIRENFDKRSIQLGDFTNALDKEKIISAMTTIEPISTMNSTLERFLLINKKIQYTEDRLQYQTKPFTEYARATLFHNESDFERSPNPDKKDTPIQKLKGEFILSKDMTSGINTDDTTHNITITEETAKKLGNSEEFAFDIESFLNQIEQTMITEEEKTLRKFVSEENNDFSKLNKQYQHGILSQDILNKLPNIIKLLSHYENRQSDISYFQKVVKSPLITKIPGLEENSPFLTRKYFNAKQIKTITGIKQLINNILHGKSYGKTFTEQEKLFNELNEEKNKEISFIEYDENFNPTISKIEIEPRQSSQGVEMYNSYNIINQHKKLTTYKNAKDYEELFNTFEQNRSQITEAMKKFYIPHGAIQNIINRIQNENVLVNPSFFDTLQSIIHLSIDPKLLSTQEKQEFAKQMKKGYFSQFTDNDFPQLHKTQDYKAAKIDHQKLFEEIEISIKHITQQFNQYLNKNQKQKEIVHELTHRDNETRDKNKEINPLHLIGFLGKISLTNFLLGKENTYQLPKYIEEKIKKNASELRKIDDDFETTIQEIVDFINQKRIYDKFLPSK